MKVIVCGAGQVGFNIARYLALEGSDVVVVDQSPELIRRVSDTLEVQALIGHASHPDSLEQAGAEDADMIIAVTQADEINMISCQVAHSLFDVPTKIARVRHQSYLNPMWANLFSRDHMPIDVIISPEIEVARAVIRRLKLPGAFEMIPLANDRVNFIGVRCGPDCPLVHTPLRQLTQLFPDLNIVVVGVLHEDKPMVPRAEDQLLPGDLVYFVVDSEQTMRAMSAFGHEEPEARRLLILGGGNIGRFLAREIEREYGWINVKIIESDPERAQVAASELTKTVVIGGDVLDSDILDEAGVSMTDTVVAVTNDDETNILASLLAKRFGTQRAITLINKMAYEPLINSLGIDVVVSPRTITVSTILQHVRRGRIHSVHTLREGFGELIEAEAMETSTLVGKALKDAKLPKSVLVGAVVRDGQVIIPGAARSSRPATGWCCSPARRPSARWSSSSPCGWSSFEPRGFHGRRVGPMTPSLSRRPRAVIFDWDNTLIDSWPVILEAQNATLTAFGLDPWSLDEARRRIRKSMRDSYPSLFGDRWEEAGAYFFERFGAIHLERLRPVPGAEALLGALVEAGTLLCVVSNKSGDNLRKEARALGWCRFFHRLVGAADAEKDKPALEPVVMALAGSGIEPGPDVWFAGDTDIDVQCARNAGCRPVLLRAEAPAKGEFGNGPPPLHVETARALSNLVLRL